MKEMTRTELKIHLNNPYADVIIKLAENKKYRGDEYTHPSLGVLNATFYTTIDSGIEIVCLYREEDEIGYDSPVLYGIYEEEEDEE